VAVDLFRDGVPVMKLLLIHRDAPSQIRPAVEKSSRHLGVAGDPEVPEVFAAVSS